MPSMENNYQTVSIYQSEKKQVSRGNSRMNQSMEKQKEGDARKFLVNLDKTEMSMKLVHDPDGS